LRLAGASSKAYISRIELSAERLGLAVTNALD
jgi:hypothetical protein